MLPIAFSQAALSTSVYKNLIFCNVTIPHAIPAITALDISLAKSHFSSRCPLRFVILTAVLLQIETLRVVTPYKFVNSWQRFEGSQCLRNVGNCLPVDVS
jgi:hypothetical protein